MTEQEIYKDAVDLWGADAQVNMMIEECAELIKAICDVNRDRGTVKNVAEEVADVEIMCGQMRYILDDADVTNFKIDKLIRLRQRIGKARCQ